MEACQKKEKAKDKKKKKCFGKAYRKKMRTWSTAFWQKEECEVAFQFPSLWGRPIFHFNSEGHIDATTNGWTLE